MVKILVICTANQIRSPFAWAAIKHKLDIYHLSEKGWMVDSAGTWAEAGYPASEKTRAMAERLGFPSLAHHQSKHISAELIKPADLILVMEKHQQEALQAEFPSIRGKIHRLTEFIAGLPYDIPDPGIGQARTDEVTREIASIIDRGIEQICKTAWKNYQISKSGQNP